MNCAGSVALCEKAPRTPTSINAAEGSVAHALAEEYVTGEVDYLGMMERVSRVIKQDGHEIEITEDMVDGAVEYADTIAGDRAQLELTRKPAAIVAHAEVKVSAPSIDTRVWGTSDYVLYRPGDKLIVYDYKYGKGVTVEAEENEQGALYVLGVLDTLLNGGAAFDEIEFVIVQPRARHAEGTVRRWRIEKEWLNAFRAKAKAAALETQNPNATLTPGDWCRWCPAMALCPAMHKAAAQSAMVAFDDAPRLTPAKMEERLPEVRLMTDAQLVKAFEWEETVNSFFEAVKEVLRERLSNGAAVAGVKLVEGRSNRQWVSEEQVIAEFQGVLGDRLWEKKLLSPAKVEKIVGKKHPIDHLTMKPEGKKAVALDKDPRPAARSSAQDAFDAVPAKETLWPL